MKNLISLITLCLIYFFSHPAFISAQNAEPVSRKSERSSMVKPAINQQNGSIERNANYFYTRSGSKEFNNFSKGNIDTLNYPLTGTYTWYYSAEGGYVTGNNEFGDLAKSNYFEISQPVSLTGILFDFLLAKGGNPSIEIIVWDNTGTNHYPGNIIASQAINLNEIKDDIINNQLTHIQFDVPVTLTTSFYAGVILPENTGDTLAIWSNTDGDTFPGIAWEKWSDNTWHPIRSDQTWGLDIAMAIFPVIDDEVALTANFSSSSTNITIGQTVNFIDQSAGNPAAWEWIFEGGDPAVSNLQNPVVTYNETGSFNVTLTVWKEAENDSKTINDYIQVSGSSVEIDTLNYPLAGDYAVYVTENNTFITGNNEWGDLAKANYFQINQNLFITGVLVEFAYATGGNPNIEIALWNNSGNDGSPGTKIGSENVSLNVIKNQINNEQMTYVVFNPPINVTSSFYAGFMLPTAAGDTLVVWSNTEGDTNPSTAWELWSNSVWYSFSDEDSWQMNIALAIFPIVQNTLGVNENDSEDLITIFPNPSGGMYSISTEMFEGETSNVSVYKSDGTLINEFFEKNGKTFHVDLTSEPAGLYFIKVETKSKNYFRKVVKN
jgi:PKD repeat protein